MSFMRNQLRQNNAANFVENTEWEDALWVRGSPSLEKLFTARNQVMQDQAFVTLLGTAQIKIVLECRNWIPFHMLESLLSLRRRFNALSSEWRRKDPLSIKMFDRALDRVWDYLNCQDVHKPKWVELRLHFPILWCLVVDGVDNELWKIVTE